MEKYLSSLNNNNKSIKSPVNLLFLRKENNSQYSKLLNNILSNKNSPRLLNYKYNSYIPKKKARNSKILPNKEIKKMNLKTTTCFDKRRKQSLIFTQIQLQNKLKEELNLQINSLINEINLNQNSKIKDNNNILSNTIKDGYTKLSKKNVVEKTKENNRKILRKKYLYDSLEDSEEFNDIEKDNFYISPNSKICIILDFLIILCLIICLIYIPLKICYFKNNCVTIYLFDEIIFYSIDIIFIIDLLINFFKAYSNNQFKLITDNKKIINKYLMSYFVFDLVSGIPILSLIIYYYKNFCFPYNINNNRHILIGISFILKLSKYQKIRDNNKFIYIINEFLSKNYYVIQIFSIIVMSIKYLCVLHLFVCCHIFIGYHYNPSWLTSVREKFGNYSFFSIYICSFYYLITTLTTVGYGDIVCISLIERIFQIIELAIGIVLYSYIVSKLGGVIKMDSYSQITYNNNLAILEEIRIAYPKMPYKLYHRIFQHLQKNVFQRKKININLLINNLPHMLKHNLLFIIHKNYIANFKFFKKCYNSNFITYTLINFKPISCKKSTIILKEDQLIDNVIFIGEGRLSLEIAIDLENPEYSIKKYLSHHYNPLKNDGIIDDKYNLSKNNKFSTIKLNEKNTTISIGNTIKSHDRVERVFDESNYQFLNISNIFKNENYGEVFIIYNKPSPLFLRVKSKIANCLLLNKTHILYLSSNYSNIWNRLFKKSLKNMIALREKTRDVVKKYSFRYNIKNIPFLQDDSNNKEKIPSNVKMKNFHGVLKKILTKNIKNVKSKRYSIASCPAIKVDEEKKLNSQSSDKIENQDDDNPKEKKKLKNSKGDTDEKKQKSNEFPDISQFSSGSSSKSSKKYPENMDDKTYIKILEEKLTKEKRKRKYYQKLYEELNKKNRYLYSQLLTKTLKFSSIDNIEGDSTNNSNINKMIINSITSQTPKNRQLQKRSLTMKSKEQNRFKFTGMGCQNSKDLSKSKIKKIARKKSKFKFEKNKRTKSITKNYFNITKNINIINKIENVDNQDNKEIEESEKNEKNNENGKSDNKSNHSKKILNIKKNKIPDLSSDIHDNSHNELFETKVIKKDSITSKNCKKKKNDSNNKIK